MSKLNETRACLQTVDLVLMVMVENLAEGRDSLATPAALADAISGATPRKVFPHLERLVRLGVLDKTELSYRVTHLGAAAMELDVPGFQPGPRETARRDRETTASLNGHGV